jgi:paraquat-inducible protein A
MSANCGPKSPDYSMHEESAARHGLLSCSHCGLLCRNRATPGVRHCPRCHSRLHLRKPNSIRRTWAYLISGFMLYIPANILPIMEARSLQDAQIDTIMSGVIYLWQEGSWHLATIVFVASIVVPCFKLIALGWLNYTVQRHETRWKRQRLRLYRFIDLIGRWSMLDIYVVALLVALVQLKLFASVEAGPAAIAFGAVVVLTLLAAASFDPRQIWDEHD